MGVSLSYVLLLVGLLAVVSSDATNTFVSSSLNSSRAESIRKAFSDAWKTYVRDAFGHDELLPIQQGYRDWVPGGIGVTLVDALDTMYLMGLEKEFDDGVRFVESHLNFSRNGTVSVFETTIRVLGGLISAFDLSQRPALLEAAVRLADRLYPSFLQTATGMPRQSINLATGHADGPMNSAVLAEIGTLQLEFKALTDRTMDNKYAERVTHIMDVIRAHLPSDGLAMNRVDPQTGDFVSDLVTFGGTGDSYFEYLLKQYLLTEETESIYLNMYHSAIDSLFSRKMDELSNPSKLLYLASWNRTSNILIRSFEHLACFMSGELCLGAKYGEQERDMEASRGLAETCYQLYMRQPLHLSPDSVVFLPLIDFQVQNPSYLLRPETVESLFLLWRHTHDSKYREMAWNIFEAISEHCHVHTGAFATIENVIQSPPKLKDETPSWLFAETFKYLFLIFSDDDVLDLSKFVLNTEAHPIRKFNPTERPYCLHGSCSWFRGARSSPAIRLRGVGLGAS